MSNLFSEAAQIVKTLKESSIKRPLNLNDDYQNQNPTKMPKIISEKKG